MDDDLPRSDELLDMPPRSILFTKQGEVFWRTVRRFTILGQAPFMPFFVDTSEFGRCRGLVRVLVCGRSVAYHRVKDVSEAGPNMPIVGPHNLNLEVSDATTTEMILTPGEALRLAQELVRVAAQAQERGYGVKGAGMGDPTA